MTSSMPVEVIERAITAMLDRHTWLPLERLRKRLSLQRITLTLDELCADLQALIDYKIICLTRGGKLCLPRNLHLLLQEEKAERELAAAEARRKKQAKERARQQDAAHRARLGRTTEIPPVVFGLMHRPVLRLTTRTGASSMGGEGVCDQCSQTSDALERLDHTSWGTVRLCRGCCLQLLRGPEPKSHPAPVRFVSAPIGSGKRR
jgi:hypothetical protein